MTLKETAQRAIDVQNACNLAGVVNSFSEAVKVLWAQPDCNGTDWVNKHPISVMFSSKIASLTGSEEVFCFSKAYNSCVEIAEQ